MVREMTRDEKRQFLLDYLKKAEDDIFNPGGPLIWQGAVGTDGRTYAAWKRTKLTDLEGRKYEVNGPWVRHGDKPGVLFTDVLYDPKEMKHIPKEEA
jgi:hypothetical protein